MSEFSINIAANGVLTRSNPHDGALLGILLAPEANLSIYFRTADAKLYQMIVPAIARVRADNILEGNIIFEICLLEGQKCPSGLVEDLCCYTNEARSHRYPKNEALANTFIPNHLKKIAREKWTLITIGSSYGCELLALSRHPVEATSISEISSTPV